MPQDQIDEPVVDCYAHAEFCRRSAVIEPNVTLRVGFLDVEQRWLRVAENIDLLNDSRFSQPDTFTIDTISTTDAGRPLSASKAYIHMVLAAGTQGRGIHTERHGSGCRS